MLFANLYFEADEGRSQSLYFRCLILPCFENGTRLLAGSTSSDGEARFRTHDFPATFCTIIEAP